MASCLFSSYLRRSDPEASRARDSENQPSKQLEQHHGERLDTGALRTPVGADSTLETVVAVHRAENASR